MDVYSSIYNRTQGATLLDIKTPDIDIGDKLYSVEYNRGPVSNNAGYYALREHSIYIRYSHITSGRGINTICRHNNLEAYTSNINILSIYYIDSETSSRVRHRYTSFYIGAYKKTDLSNPNYESLGLTRSH